jgi:exopolysaccharide biosynthesis polyprenyl glycosylphosphotransferase
MSETRTEQRTTARLVPADASLDRLAQSRSGYRRELTGRATLVAADAIAVAAAMGLVAAVTGDPITLWALGVLPLYILVAKTAGLYDRDQFVLHKTTLDEVPVLVAVAAIFVLFIQGIRALEFQDRSHPFLFLGVLVLLVVVMRVIARAITVRVTASERVLVVGDASTASMIRRKLAADPSLNAGVIGRVAMQREPQEFGDHLLGTVDELPAVIKQHEVERVIVAPALGAGDDVVDTVRVATASGVRVAVLPRLLEVMGTSVDFDDLGGRLLMGVRGFGLAPSSRFLKRAFDIIVATGLLLVLAPMLVLIALAIKLTSSGPVFFRQTRVGRHGREFQLLKFRTMVQNAEDRKGELLEHNQAAPLFKIANDPRTTRVGARLRRYSLDELPQLFNVLRGDMSLVGPRPLVTEEDRLFSGWQRRRYHVAPGITGPWQILGSSRVPVEDMLTLDYLYCSSWSLWLDAKILARTIPYVLSRRSGEFKGSPR